MSVYKKKRHFVFYKSYKKASI